VVVVAALAALAVVVDLTRVNLAGDRVVAAGAGLVALALLVDGVEVDDLTGLLADAVNTALAVTLNEVAVVADDAGNLVLVGVALAQLAATADRRLQLLTRELVASPGADGNVLSVVLAPGGGEGLTGALVVEDDEGARTLVVGVVSRLSNAAAATLSIHPGQVALLVLRDVVDDRALLLRDTEHELLGDHGLILEGGRLEVSQAEGIQVLAEGKLAGSSHGDKQSDNGKSAHRSQAVRMR